MGPVLPGLTDPEAVFSDLEGLVDHVLVDKLNLRRGSWSRLEPFMARHYPKLLPLYRSLQGGDSEFWNDTWLNIADIAKRHGVKTNVV